MQSSDTGDEILQQAAKISSLITTARQLMGDGKTIDLAKLEGKVRVLCENLKAADIPSPEQIGNALAAIIEDLNRLEREMTNQHAAAGGQTLENTIKRAIDAYGPDKQDGEKG